MLGIFIMDVSHSTSFHNTEEISHFLRKLERRIEAWSAVLPHSYVNFRMGDELFFVSDSPSSTLVLAYYIKLLWPFNHQPVKFGIAVGEAALPDHSFEHWNDPLIKQARLALDEIKTHELVDFKLAAPVDTALYNDILFYYLTDILQSQTAMQRQVYLMNLTAATQKELAETFQKSISTISTHLKKGRSRQLALILQSLERFDETYEPRMKQLIHDSIKEAD
ncbi:hypothetical protein [Macrococcus equipercicus]|uniref:Uncharacterized protein n=1 Tax=Macrococcus equipercicus TaxID=69967 RepID=A0A9Q9BKC5_9STAP|nr:hypothetical protein [Macrococcus equipercicus]KAA1040271.1 hypothetical protein ERX35_004580 [Macrococcus equipercicus]UTH12785.1 hypothetical protein KFV11_05710 [Macrococcus equipercicus]